MESKAEHSFKELDKARSQGLWSTIPELVKRYKKYHPQETVLPATAIIEVELTQLLQSSGSNKHSTMQPKVTVPLPGKSRQSVFGKPGFIIFTPPPELYGPPAPSSTLSGSEQQHHVVPFVPHLSGSQAHPLLTRLQELISKQAGADHLETPDDWQAQLSKIVLARLYYESGRYKKALESLERLALRFEDVNWGYGLVLLVQARVIKGICYEMEGSVPDALEAYDAAWEVVESHLTERSEMLSYWIEDALYRAILLRTYQNAPVRQTLKSMRAYYQLSCSHWSTHWRPYKQWNILSLYTQYLTKTYQEDSYLPRNVTITNDSTISVAPTTTSSSSQFGIYEELVSVLTLYHALFNALEPKLSTKETSKRVLEFTNLIFIAHDVIGWGELNNIRRTLQFLYHAKEKTFNNPCIARLLFFTLMRLGDLDEAKYAFRGYMEIVGLSDVDKTNVNGIEVTPNGVLDVQTKVSAIQKKLRLMADLDDPMIYESEALVLKVLLAAVLLYGRECHQGDLASSLADLALELARESTTGNDNDSLNNDLLAKCYRAHGAAYGLRASQCDDPELRSELHGDALHSLNKAVELQSTWDAYYELAVQQAQMRDIGSAVTSITHSLQLKSDHLPSWHLLALLSTSRQFHQLPKALQAIEAGLKSCDLPAFSPLSSGIPMMSWDNSKEDNSRHHFDIAEAYLTTRMTQIQLLETLEGPDAVLSFYSDIFTIYAKLAQQLGLVNGEFEAAATTREYITGDSKASLMVDGLSVSGGRRPSSVSRNRSLSASNSTNTYNPVDHQQQSNSTLASPPSNGAINTPKPSNSEETISTRKSSVDKLKPKEKKKRGLIDMRLGKRIHSVAGHSTTPSNLDKQSQSSMNPSVSSSRRPSKPLLDNVSLASMVAPSLSSFASSRRSSDTGTLVSNHMISKENAFGRSQRQRWNTLVVKLWVMCTSSFIKAGRLDEAVQAILEAEEVGLTDADVWHQLGLLCLKAYQLQKDDDDELYNTALDAFKKALAIDPDHIQTHVDMAATWIEHQDKEWELAEALLDRTTKSLGWDHEEAWYLLGQVYQHQQSMDRAKECLLYALELSETKPLRPFSLLPRFV
ncbi:hypothetical protein BC941DRAFT_517938 [Chlamydoabsidia padenii]|nr:hypothetical protein BC941DRAFT_517938 [Chlamydoabsidia padenii]